MPVTCCERTPSGLAAILGAAKEAVPTFEGLDPPVKLLRVGLICGGLSICADGLGLGRGGSRGAEGSCSIAVDGVAAGGVDEKEGKRPASSSSKDGKRCSAPEKVSFAVRSYNPIGAFMTGEVFEGDEDDPDSTEDGCKDGLLSTLR